LANFDINHPIISYIGCNNKMSIELQSCYICYEKESQEDPYANQPCCCKGSIAIHLSCLKEQIKRSRICSICHHRYQLEYLPNKDGKELITKTNKHGDCIEYTINLEGKKHGMYTLKNSKGQIISSQTYSDGMMDGPIIEYYESGQIKSICRCKQNRLEGDYSEWYEDGTIKEESQYINGLKHGESTIWKRRGGIRISTLLKYVHGEIIEEGMCED